MLETLTIRAINPDNKLEIDKLIQLYLNAYGKRYPFSYVYDYKFWSGQIGHRLVTIGLFLQSNLFGSISLRADGRDKQNIQLCFSVLDPRLLHLRDEVEPALISLIERLSDNQNWTQVYYFDFDRTRSQHSLADRISLAHETAILPCFVKNFSAAESPIGLVIKARRLGECKTKPIYVPKEHKGIIELLYKEADIKREFDSSISKRVKTTGSTAEGNRGIRVLSRLREHSHVALVDPSLTASFKSTIKALATVENPNRFVFLNLFDPATPAFYEELKNYRFVGIAPNLQGRDSLVLWQGMKFDSNSYDSAKARMLAHYSENYDLNLAKTAADSIDFMGARESP